MDKIVKIKNRPTDKRIIWSIDKTIDGLSKKYYGSEQYWRIIMMANPKYSISFDIENGDIIRVPLPIEEVMDEIDLRIKNKDNE